MLVIPSVSAIWTNIGVFAMYATRRGATWASVVIGEVASSARWTGRCVRAADTVAQRYPNGHQKAVTIQKIPMKNMTQTKSPPQLQR